MTGTSEVVEAGATLMGNGLPVALFHAASEEELCHDRLTRV